MVPPDKKTAMMHELKYKHIIQTLLLIAGICALAVLAFLLAYQYDNKYTLQGPRAERGVLRLDEQTLEQYPVIILVDGWEYYVGDFTAPNDAVAPDLPPQPDEYIYIGQYGGFDYGRRDITPHGSAAYRLVIKLPETTRNYMLELPEIFSSYRLYVDGKEMRAMGNPEPQNYHPAVGNKSISFEASNRVELIFIVSDFTHFYSGMVYPPAFGDPDAVSELLYVRFLIRVVMCSFVAFIGLLALLIGLLSGTKAQSGLFALICLCFIGYTSYPLVRTFISDYYPYYALEQLSYSLMLALVLLLQSRICRLHRYWRRISYGLGLVAVLASLVTHISLPLGNPRLMYAFSDFMTLYAWITAGLITASAAWAVYESRADSLPLLCGVLIFDCALVVDRLLPLYEPILTGWFTESAGFALVTAIGVAIGMELASGYKESAVLSERAAALDRLSEMQQAHYTVLEEKSQEVATARHDLRHHYTVISRFVSNRELDKLEAYLTQTLEVTDDQIETYCSSNVINVLGNHYKRMAERDGIIFELRCDIQNSDNPTHGMGLTDTDLCGILGNLLDNAVEACRRIAHSSTDDAKSVPFIRVGIMRKGSLLTLRVINSTNGDLKESSGGIFLSSKRANSTGYGQSSVKAIARKYGGDAVFNWDRAARTFDSLVTCRIQE